MEAQIQDVSVKNKKNFWIILGAFFKVAIKSVKFIKIALVGASFAAYSYMFTWEFSAMLLIMIFIHEYGHVWAMKRSGIKTKGIYLIPFLGGVAVADEDFKTRNEEAFCAMMGPWFGFGISLIYLLCFYITGNPIFAAGCAWCSLINLFNLLPMNPLDGGRVLKSLAFSVGNTWGIIFLGAGLLFMIVIVVFFQVWFFLLLLFFASLEFVFEIRTRNSKKEINSLLIKGLELQKEIITKDFRAETEDEFITANEMLKDIENKMDKLNLVVDKPVMNKKQLIFYTFAYIVTCWAFFQLIIFVEEIPGCKEALEMLK